MSSWSGPSSPWMAFPRKPAWETNAHRCVMSSLSPARCLPWVAALVFAAKWRRNPVQKLARSLHRPSAWPSYTSIRCFPSIAPILVME
uniref:Uncharacterized protein n=1 Tax=Triticum urartu TaxID=4572 RepID=A0A8R7UX99_TRIUA